MNRMNRLKNITPVFNPQSVPPAGASFPAMGQAAKAEAQRRAKERRREEKELAKARQIAEAPACEMIEGAKLRAGMFISYVLGRLAALRAFGVLDWRLIDEAARLRGTSWREFVAVEFVRWRIRLKGFVENGNASCWRGSAVCVWRQCGEASALTGTWVELNRTAAEVIEGNYEAVMKLGGTEELHAEYLPIMELFALGAVAAVDAREARTWKEAEAALRARRSGELNPRTLLPHMYHELAQFRDEPGVDWSEIDAAAAAKGRTWQAFIGWALIRYFIAYTGRCWWQLQIYDEVQKGQCPDLWTIVNHEARKVNGAADTATIATTRAGIPAWLEG